MFHLKKGQRHFSPDVLRELVLELAERGTRTANRASSRIESKATSWVLGRRTQK